ncbi:hypothetical protein ACFVW9_38335 [Streptomyces sp. NPDC058217]|uniref:hypothetical protein n=1 Tax=Streptomyces sp. NPDC058217 TaxID=3346384 RepID=UPI0036E1ACC8
MRPGLVTVVVGSGVQSTEPSREVAAYLTAQIAGAIGESLLADAMFTEPVVCLSTHDRSAGHMCPGEWPRPSIQRPS